MDGSYIEGKQDAQIEALSGRVDELSVRVDKNATEIKEDFHRTIEPLRVALVGNDSKGGVVATVAWHDKVLKWGMTLTSSMAVAAFVRAFFK